MPTIEDIADELLALTPAEFTAARNARAKQLGGELGAAVKALPRPSAGAWATNLLARAKSDELAQLFALGDALRDAQSEADRDTLADLTRQRRALVSALAKLAAGLADDAGHAVNATAVAEVERTLQAGMTDPAAAAAISSGRLLRGLSGDGLDAVDLDDAVAGQPARARAVVTSIESKRAVKAAEVAVAEAKSALEDADRMSQDAGRAKEALALERQELREHLAEVEAELTDAARAVEAADRDRAKAARALDEAEEARAALD
ncbi:DNA-binding transcriptional MerR regulator [Conyzicola lurida]|uniref:DNA-binding transcriptional MerR regulator n=1 Tax=Conyzicola lurida TaxID=1172621 RepID=A0A841APN3_9MICO|nr:transposase [Conyzicola lurida]MBB5843721.1 DNA-binding transcriptional MerR regulator [Conyzicola lurida]